MAAGLGVTTLQAHGVWSGLISRVPAGSIPDGATVPLSPQWRGSDFVRRFWSVRSRSGALNSEIVGALRCLAPDAELNKTFLAIIAQGTGHVFNLEHNEDWLLRGRPMLEAFFHARYMLEMVIKHGESRMNPKKDDSLFVESGWAAVLYLYNLR